MRHDAEPGLVVVDVGAGDEALGDDAVLRQLLDHQPVHPLGNPVARRIQALLAGPRFCNWAP